jgi:hypothetical protein
MFHENDRFVETEYGFPNLGLGFYLKYMGESEVPFFDEDGDLVPPEFYICAWHDGGNK